MMNIPLKAKLQARRAEILQRKSELVAEMIDDVPDRLGDTIDITTDEQLESHQLILETRLARELTEIDAALQRIADETYGECENCGDDIPPKRLEIHPLARHCVDCLEELETDQKRRYKRPGLLDEFHH